MLIFTNEGFFGFAKHKELMKIYWTFIDHLKTILKFPYDDINNVIVHPALNDDTADIVNLDNHQRYQLWSQYKSQYNKIIRIRIVNLTKMWNILLQDIQNIIDEFKFDDDKKIVGDIDIYKTILNMNSKQFCMKILAVSFLMGRTDINHALSNLVKFNSQTPGIMWFDTWRHLMYNY